MHTTTETETNSTMKEITIYKKFLSPIRVEMEKEGFWFEKIAKIKSNIGLLEKELNTMGSGVARLRQTMSGLNSKSRG